MAESQRKPIAAGTQFTMKTGEVIEVLQYVNKSKILVEFKDDFQHQKWVEKSQITRACIVNPFTKTLFGRGFLGVGSYVAKREGHDTKEYVVWSGMFWRCYSENRLIRNPTYRGSEVADLWANYQNFAEWYCNKPQYHLDWQVDKDLLFPGNKIYSPEKCCLLPPEINSFLADKRPKENGLPPGVHWGRKEGKYKAQIKDRFSKNQRLLGMSDDPDELFILYKNAKESQALYLAEKWKELLEIDAYKALKLYKMENDYENQS